MMGNLARRYSIAIVGGGLAGSALASLLARQGRDVALFEKDRFPRDKLCGEFLSPESRAILADLGLEQAIAESAPTIRAARFSAPSGAWLSAQLPDAALGVSRLRLDEMLFDAATAAGAATFSGHAVTDIERSSRGSALEVRTGGEAVRVLSDVVVCTYGRRTKLDRTLGRAFMERRHPYVGFKRHHRPAKSPAGRRVDADLEDHVEIHAFEGGYCGMSHVEDGQINVCMLLEQRFLDGIDRPDWPQIADAISRANRRLADRLDGLEPAEDGMHAVAQVPFEIKGAFDDGVFYCGDAAGMIAPLTGDGQAMALESAHLLADSLADLPRTPAPGQVEAAGRAWSRRWRMRYEPRLRLGRTLQWLLFREGPLEMGVRAIGAVPGLADALARWTRSASH